MIGIDGEDFSECLERYRKVDLVNTDIESGRKASILGTPAAFIIYQNNNFRIVIGNRPLNRLQALVDEMSD